MGAVSSVVNTVVDVVEDVGSTLDDIIIQPAIDIVEGGIELSENSLQTAGNVSQSVMEGDFSQAEDEFLSGVNNIDNILSETYMDVRDPLEAAAVIGGNYLLPGSSMVTSHLVSEGAQDILASDGGQTLNFAAGATGGYQGNTANYGFNSTDPNAVGSATGPDNIDVGGGYNPATDAASGGAGSTVSVPTPDSGDNIDAGGGYNPATNAPSAANQELTAQQVLDMIKSEQAGTGAGTASNGLTFKQGLDATRAALLLNSITGDPLGLNDALGQQGLTSGTTGYAMAPVPADWQSAGTIKPYAPIDLSTIFSNQNMLGGTQWQNLPSQQPNISFNDIFAAGQQQTPMGSPVDINQIVSSILGQASTSQKSS